MLEYLTGKKTIIAAFLLALYGFLRGMGVHVPELAPGWEEGLLAVVFLILRLVTKAPIANPAPPSLVR